MPQHRGARGKHRRVEPIDAPVAAPATLPTDYTETDLKNFVDQAVAEVRAVWRFFDEHIRDASTAKVMRHAATAPHPLTLAAAFVQAAGDRTLTAARRLVYCDAAVKTLRRAGHGRRFAKAQAHTLRAAVLADLRRFDEAKRALRLSTQYDVTNSCEASRLLTRAVILEATGKPEQAARLRLEARELDLAALRTLFAHGVLTLLTAAPAPGLATVPALTYDVPSWKLWDAADEEARDETPEEMEVINARTVANLRWFIHNPKPEYTREEVAELLADEDVDHWLTPNAAGFYNREDIAAHAFSSTTWSDSDTVAAAFVSSIP